MTEKLGARRLELRYAAIKIGKGVGFSIDENLLFEKKIHAKRYIYG